MTRADVCVIGAGVAGIACAQGLSRLGMSVVLIDRMHPMADCLKAEKLGGEAIPALLRLGFKSSVAKTLTPLFDVDVYFGTRALGTQRIDPPEGATRYHLLINDLRANLDSRIDFRPRVRTLSVESRADVVNVLTDGASVECRLAIVATGEARELLDKLGAASEREFPEQVFVSAFDMQGTMRGDSVTFHRPVAGGPVAYATFFRRGDGLRANIFCPGPISDAWQRDLRIRPLEVLAQRNRAIARVAAGWRITSAVMIRKMHVTRLRPPSLARVVVLGDAASAIDPSGSGGLSLALRAAELLRSEYAPAWLGSDDITADAIARFYEDEQLTRAVDQYFARGRYLFALNHDRSLRGVLRRLRYAATQRRNARTKSEARPSPPWSESEAPLFEQDVQ
jgi:2-polyprenyl-6-methoxyphenol hydroxylase-like FAD-dependent oxidoreductase